MGVNKEKVVSRSSVSLKITFLIGGSFKIIIFPFGQVSGLFVLKAFHPSVKIYLGIISFKSLTLLVDSGQT